MSHVNYSIRLDEELREDMRGIPNMPDRIREFIEAEIERENEEGTKGTTAAERFLHQVLDDHGEVGAYCLWQLDEYLFRDSYYLENVENRFKSSDDVRLSAKRIRDGWQEHDDISDELVEDVLDMRGYIDQFYSNARNLANNADGANKWALWTVLQLHKHKKGQRDGRTNFNLKIKSVRETLDFHGFTEEEIDSAVQTLVKVGGLKDYYSSNAYGYTYLQFPDYVVDAIEEGLQDFEREVRTTVSDYCEERPYVEMLTELTRGPDRQPYAKELDTELDVTSAIRDGSVVILYKPGRSSTGRRSSLPREHRCVLSPSIREVVSDALYRHNTSEPSS